MKAIYEDCGIMLIARTYHFSDDILIIKKKKQRQKITDWKRLQRSSGPTLDLSAIRAPFSPPLASEDDKRDLKGALAWFLKK